MGTRVASSGLVAIRFLLVVRLLLHVPIRQGNPTVAWSSKAVAYPVAGPKPCTVHYQAVRDTADNAQLWRLHPIDNDTGAVTASSG
jgi:hypothetical protein